MQLLFKVVGFPFGGEHCFAGGIPAVEELVGFALFSSLAQVFQGFHLLAVLVAQTRFLPVQVLQLLGGQFLDVGLDQGRAQGRVLFCVFARLAVRRRSLTGGAVFFCGIAATW